MSTSEKTEAHVLTLAIPKSQVQDFELVSGRRVEVRERASSSGRAIRTSPDDVVARARHECSGYKLACR